MHGFEIVGVDDEPARQAERGARVLDVEQSELAVGARRRVDRALAAADLDVEHVGHASLAQHRQRVDAAAQHARGPPAVHRTDGALERGEAFAEVTVDVGSGFHTC